VVIAGFGAAGGQIRGVGLGIVRRARLAVAGDGVVGVARLEVVVAGLRTVLGRVVGVRVSVAAGVHRHGVAGHPVLAAAGTDLVVARVAGAVLRRVEGIGVRGAAEQALGARHGVAGDLVVVVRRAGVRVDLVIAGIALVGGVRLLGVGVGQG